MIVRPKHYRCRPALEGLESRQLLADFTVTTAANTGAGSLRQAITAANDNPGPDRILFDIPDAQSKTITPSSFLPTINEAVTIDGYSQPGTSVNTDPLGFNAQLAIRINGSNAGTDINGLVVNAGGVVIRGLMVTNF